MNAKIDKQLEMSEALGHTISPETRERIKRLSQDPVFTKDLALNGKQVLEILQCKPGPIVGKVMAYLVDSVISDPSLNTHYGLIGLIERYVKEHP